MMKKANKRSLGTIVLALVAIICIAVGGIGAARAASNYTSNIFKTSLEMKQIGVTLNENGKAVAVDGEKGELLSALVPERECFHLGQAYDEVLTVTNSGAIDQYVRVVLDLYWADRDGNKMTELLPSHIGMKLNKESDWISDLAGNGWIVDPSSSYLNGNGEQLILYYSKALASGEESAPISNYLAVDNIVGQAVTKTKTGNATVFTYRYDGVRFGISAEVDAVQTHNAADAALSAWGANLSFDNGSVSLGGQSNDQTATDGQDQTPAARN